MNFFDHKNLGNHLLQLCPKVVKHPVYSVYIIKIGNIRQEELEVKILTRTNMGGSLNWPERKK